MSETTVFIGNFWYDTTPEYLRDVLNSCGRIKYLKFIYDQKTGHSKGYAFCKFYTEDAASFAVENLDGVLLNGRQLRVEWANNKPY